MYIILAASCACKMIFAVGLLDGRVGRHLINDQKLSAEKMITDIFQYQIWVNLGFPV